MECSLSESYIGPGGGLLPLGGFGKNGLLVLSPSWLPRSLDHPSLQLPSSPATTRIPSLTSLPLISVFVPSVAPTVTSSGRTKPSGADDPKAAMLWRFRGLCEKRRLVYRRIDLFALGRPTQRRVGHQQDVRPLVHFELHVGRQIGQQFAVGIVGRHDHGVRDDVLRHLGVHADLSHFAVERLPLVGIDREPHGHVEPDASDVGLVDRGPDLHLGQVLGDEKQAGGIEAATTV